MNGLAKKLLFFLMLYCPAVFSQYCLPGRFDTELFDSLDIEVIPNIEYGIAKNVDGEMESLRLDIYRPDITIDPLVKKPLIVYVHGGSLKAGDKMSGGAKEIGFGMAERGFIYASINYRLGWNDVGECRGDTVSLQYALYRAVQDTKASVRFLKENADLYGIDTNYIFLGGSSVGCTVTINAAYAEQQDFPEYAYDSLGSVDSSTNTLYGHSFDIKGIFSKAAGIEFPGILDNNNVPILFFHGTCDFTVPYNNGPLFYCEKPVEYMHYYGGWYLSRLMQEKHIPYSLYSNEAYGHDSADNDTVVLYTGNFLNQILCDDLPLSSEYYRYNSGGCVVTSMDSINLTIYPNPFSENVIVSVNAADEQDVTMEIFNAAGELIFHDIKHYVPPITQYEIQLNAYAPANGIYFLRFSSNALVRTALIYRQG